MMNTLQQMFRLGETEFEKLKSNYNLQEFSLEINCFDIGEGFEIIFNNDSVKDSIQSFNTNLNTLENKVLIEDYIAISLFNEKGVRLYKHESKRNNFKTNSIFEVINQPEKYPNYVDENTIPWWKSEKN